MERVIKQHISTYTPFCFFNQMFMDIMANYSPSLFLHLVHIPRWYFFSQVNVTVDLTSTPWMYAEGMCAIPGMAHKSLLHIVSLPLAWVRQAKQTWKLYVAGERTTRWKKPAFLNHFLVIMNFHSAWSPCSWWLPLNCWILHVLIVSFLCACCHVYFSLI